MLTDAPSANNRRKTNYGENPMTAQMNKIKSNIAISESSFTGGINVPHFKHRKPKSTVKYISEFKEEVTRDGFVTREMKPKSVVAHKKKTNNMGWT